MAYNRLGDFVIENETHFTCITSYIILFETKLYLGFDRNTDIHYTYLISTLKCILYFYCTLVGKIGIKVLFQHLFIMILKCYI